MTKVILNEREFAEKCLSTGEIEGKPFYTLCVLAKYYYHVLGYRKKRICAALENFMKENYPLYKTQRLEWDATIEKIANSVKKYNLYEISGVSVTKSELETIDSLKTTVLRRVAFTLLCLAKLGNLKNPNNNGWVNYDAKDVFKIARVTCRTIERYLYLNRLYVLGLLELPKKNDNLSVRVTYIDDNSEQVLFISDFRELGYEYLLYRGENFIRCAKCGVLTRPNKNRTKKYCKECSMYEKKETKKIVCVDCGKEFKVSSMNNKTCRCENCGNLHRKKRHREIVQNSRKNKM